MKTPEEVARECLKLVVDTGRTLSESAEQAIRARDAEWREAVEGVAKRIDEWFRREETNMETQGEPEFSQCELMATAYRDCSNLLRELLKGEVK